jgi:hypothetical protein
MCLIYVISVLLIRPVHDVPVRKNERSARAYQFLRTFRFDSFSVGIVRDFRFGQSMAIVVHVKRGSNRYLAKIPN